MKAQDNNIKLVRKLFEFFNLNDPKKINACDDLLALNLQLHDPVVKGAKSGIQTYKEAELGYIQAFPNKKVTIDNIFSSEDQVAVHWTCVGTQEGPFEGHAPTNRRIKISGVSTYRISNAKINEIWQVWDYYGLLDQLGELQHTRTHTLR